VTFKSMRVMFNKPSFLGIRRKTFLWVALAILLIGTAGFVYYKLVYQPKQAVSAAAVIQTAAVRQGDLTISASGTGTLMAADEKELGFTAGGTITKIFVKAGDQVKAGDILAEVGSPEAQINYAKAKNKYRELTSPAAVAAAQLAVADAQTNLHDAQEHLGYLISPDVMYWETEITKAEQDLKKAQTKVSKSPADIDAQQDLKSAAAYLDFAKVQLSDAHVLYTDEYVLENFVVNRKGERYLAVPTELDITQARTAIGEARNNLKDSKELYKVLTGGSMPVDPSSNALVELQQAQRDLQDAQAVLDGTRIYAPISGTIIAVNTSVGNTVGADPVIVVADLSQLELQFYLDAADWDKAVVGNEANVTFEALPDQVFTGKVTQVDQQLDTSSNSSAVKGTIALTESVDQINLPIGATAYVDIISQRVQNAVLVPIEALHEISPGKYTVYVVVNDQPQLRMVEIGLQDLIYAEVKSGLEPGELVATGAVKVQ